MPRGGGMDSNVLHMSDVIEVIESSDPHYTVPCAMNSTGPSASRMYAAGGAAVPSENSGPYVRMVEQPAPKALRFRYECEGRSAGSIPGVNSTPENKTYPTIQVVGYQGRAVVVVSCVTKDAPYKPHPHNLVGKDGFKKGVCTLEINQENMMCSFSNLGIQCVKKKDIEDALKVREEIRVDPFRTGFNHRSQPTGIDLNAVRLAFQVFLEGPEPGKFKQPLTPIVSDPIYDKKAMSDLVICRLSDCSAFASGGRDIILLCEKVAKEDIAVRFYEETGEWSANADFQPTDVHKQVAIAFKVPAYKDIQIQKEVDVKVQLIRPSDGATSEPRDFKYVPIESALNKRKPSQSVEPRSKRPMPEPSLCEADTSRRARVTMPGAAPGVVMTSAPPVTSMQQPACFTGAQQQQQQTIKIEPSEYRMPSPTYQPPSMSPGGVAAVTAMSPSDLRALLAGRLPQLTPLQPSIALRDGFTGAGGMGLPAQFLQYQPAPSTSPIPGYQFAPGPADMNNFNMPLNFDPRTQMSPNIAPMQPPPDDGARVIHDLDSANFDMQSSELRHFMLDANNLSENLSGQLRLCDDLQETAAHAPVEPSRTEAENMSTDSLSGILRDKYAEML